MTNKQLQLAWYTFVHDFLDAGIEEWTTEIRESGANAANVAVVYHTARDLLPRNPRRRMRFMAGGSHYFEPDPADYPSSARPFVDPEVRGIDAVQAIRSSLRSHDLGFNAWVVFLHNSRLAGDQPQLAQRNVFGDGMLTDLCPSNPEVRDYAVAVARQVALLEPRTVIAESLHFHGLRHGYHHERYLFEVGELGEMALSWCFCDHCRSEATADGLDIERIEQWARTIALRAFEGTPQRLDVELTRSVAAAVGGADIEGFIAMRCRVVARLVAEVRRTVRECGSRVAFIDPSGAVKGWASAEPTGEAVHESGWAFGIDVRDVASHVDAIEVLGYTRDLGRLADDVTAYRNRIGATPLRLSMRPSTPDTDDAEHLRHKLTLAGEAGIEAIDFYHLGLLTPAAPACVRAATADLSQSPMDT